MVESKHFAEWSSKKFSFYSVDFNSVDDLPESERQQMKSLIEDHKIVETPSLLFLSPETLAKKYLHSGTRDTDAALIVREMAAELN